MTEQDTPKAQASIPAETAATDLQDPLESAATGRSVTTAAPTALSAESEDEPSNELVQPLFRSEVIEARRSQWMGTVLLTPRISHRVFAVLALLAVAAMAALLILGSYTRKASVTGWLVPEQGLVQIFAPQQGVVTEVFHQEGEQVKAGEQLLALSAERQTGNTGTGAEAEITRSLDDRRASLQAEITQQQQLLAQQRKSLSKRLRAMQSEIDQFTRELNTQQSRAQLATSSADRMRDLGAKGFASKMQIQQLEENELDQRGRVRTLERQRGERERELAGLQADFDDLPFKVQSQIATLKRAIAELEQDLVNSEARRRILVVAPTAGTLTAMQIHPGSNANPATPLLSLLPAGSKLEAQLFTPSRSIGFVRVGQPVLVRYQAYPYQKFGHYSGTVKSISMTAISPNELPPQLARLTSLTSTGEPLYRIIVALDSQSVTAYGQPQPLHPGMQLESEILLERRKLYEWVLEPLFTLTGKL
ncbi:MAG: HlyD family efflux transporter periplasmic adaptor subunit [Ideonella sp.]